jgi:hypothetical protein
MSGKFPELFEFVDWDERIEETCRTYVDRLKPWKSGPRIIRSFCTGPFDEVRGGREQVLAAAKRWVNEAKVHGGELIEVSVKDYSGQVFAASADTKMVDIAPVLEHSVCGELVRFSLASCHVLRLSQDTFVVFATNSAGWRSWEEYEKSVALIPLDEPERSPQSTSSGEEAVP